jgi:hypothetical protein
MAKTNSKSVLYHSPNAKPKPLVVLKESKDGTVEIGTEDGMVVVRGCRITTEPEMGHVTLAEVESAVVVTDPTPTNKLPQTNKI